MRTFFTNFKFCKTHLLTVVTAFTVSSNVPAQGTADSVSTMASVVSSHREAAVALADTIGLPDTIQPHYYRVNRAFLRTIPYDLKYVVTSPVRWQGRDWGRFALFGGTVATSMLVLDKPVREIMLRNKNGNFDKASDIFYPLGNRFPPLLLTGMYLTGVITNNRKLEHSTLKIAKSLAIATVVYTASKSVIRRQRPTRTDNPYEFVSPINSKGYTSFPSGHSNTAFAVATAFALEYKQHRWVPWVAYTLATGTAVSRLYDDRHWFSDVIIGASIGHIVTRTVYKLEEKRREKRTTNLKGLL